ncbi:MAG: hypothetical protein C0602_06475 [Denitrovibrio sp.]|nr:MAG: hypothetical protein C0602_06475 [Denitrovibrio sp.]
MRSAKEFYGSQEKLTYDEILQLTQHAREMRSKSVHDSFSSMFRKVGSFFKKAIHFKVNDKYSDHGAQFHR